MELGLMTIEGRLRNPRWSTIYAEGHTCWPSLVPPSSSDLSSTVPFRIEVDPNVESTEMIWKLWATRNGSVRLEEEGLGEGSTVILWDGQVQRRYVSNNGLQSSSDDPRLTHGLFGLEPFVNAGGLLAALSLSLVGMEPWRDRVVARLNGVPIPDSEAPPLDGQLADIKGLRSIYRLGIGCDEFLVAVDVETGMIVGTVVRLQSVEINATEVELIEFDAPIPAQMFASK